MANLRDIRKRIQSVTGTKKLTRAMKLVAASKLRRAQENLVRLRPYTNMVIEMASIVAARLDEEDHALLSQREGNRRLYIILTSDKGLCGGFNANILRFAESTMRHAEKDAEIKLAVAGRKGMNYFRIHEIETVRQFVDFYDDVTFEKASQIASWFMDDYIRGNIDRVSIVYNEFKSAVVQSVVDEQVLPIRRATLDTVWKDVDFICEPSKPELLEKLLSMYTATEIYRAIMESTASEHGARMTAMENATNNAEDMIKDLTLEYNKARQASITKELMEIVGGSEVQREG